MLRIFAAPHLNVGHNNIATKVCHWDQSDLAFWLSEMLGALAQADPGELLSGTVDGAPVAQPLRGRLTARPCGYHPPIPIQ